MSEFDKLRALLDVAPAEPRPAPKVMLQDRKPLRQGPRNRRRWLIVLFMILGFDAIYLLARAFMG